MRILPDANVLYPRTLRDWLLILQAAPAEIFTTCWTVDILAETIANLRKNNPNLPGGAATAIHDHITSILTERIDDYTPGPDSPVADPYDRHVHAAAVAAGVDLLVTSDADFLNLPADVVERLPYEIWAPDDFFVLVDDQEPAIVHAVTCTQWDHWRRREPSSDLAHHLDASGCPKFAQRVREHIRTMR